MHIGLSPVKIEEKIEAILVSFNMICYGIFCTFCQYSILMLCFNSFGYHQSLEIPLLFFEIVSKCGDRCHKQIELFV